YESYHMQRVMQRTIISSLLSILSLTPTLTLVGCSGGTSSPDPENSEGQSSARSGSQSQTGPQSAGKTDLSDPAEADPADYREQAEDIVGDFSDEELAGSLIIGTWEDTNTQTAVDMVEQNHLGGVIVMGYNLSENPTTEQVTDMTEQISAARTKGQPVSIGVGQD